jgi:hypothetical protein
MLIIADNHIYLALHHIIIKYFNSDKVRQMRSPAHMAYLYNMYLLVEIWWRTDKY